MLNTHEKFGYSSKSNVQGTAAISSSFDKSEAIPTSNHQNQPGFPPDLAAPASDLYGSGCQLAAATPGEDFSTNQQGHCENM